LKLPYAYDIIKAGIVSVGCFKDRRILRMKQPNNTKYSVALYMRLSRDDENYGDSVSIETQRTILRQYVNDHNLYVIDEYVDDGWSGTNFAGVR